MKPVEELQASSAPEAWQAETPPAVLGADERCPGLLEPLAIRHLVVHCSATDNDSDIGAREIHAMHLGFGWHGIGYHRVVRRDGRIEPGRPDYWMGAHVLGQNESSLGVCLIGCDRFTLAQFDALEGVLRAWRDIAPQARICGHRDFETTSKTCPNFDVAAYCLSRGLSASPAGPRTAVPAAPLPPT